VASSPAGALASEADDQRQTTLNAIRIEMSSPAFTVQVKPLQKARDSGAFDLYAAALEWSLVDPVVVTDRSDLKSEARWRDRVQPFDHQVENLITYCRRLPVTLLADDVGLGKTISAGLIISELMSRRRVQRFLVVAPKLLGAQWQEELESKFGIHSQVVTGKALLTTEPAAETRAVITTYHTARDHILNLPRDRFDMLILDEAHKLRNLYGVPQPPVVAKRFRQALSERTFRFVLMLTATPIQNRLWDLYSLVDLLTVARGHQNPFGSETAFSRKFIADSPTAARQLRPDAREEFRGVVYGYMSRVRRAEVRLHFPTREILNHGVKPTPQEAELIRLIAQPIQGLNKLSQISILQSLTSSPDACARQLENMAANRTFPALVARKFRAAVKAMGTSAKLQGVAQLVRRLQKENPRSWRMVIFTQRRETQAAIVAHLETMDVLVRVINGSTTARNQDTLADFRASPPKANVIVSTEAGSEGVNLQVANVLVNYDLPWNPMIVEQRVGRVQRLGSEHKHVAIYNVTLRGTFEDYIVARLMQKLQLATHAIGDIESLLDAAGIASAHSDSSQSFEEQVLRLVLDSLAGKDVESATRAAEESIEEARRRLDEETAYIDEALGSMHDAATRGPRGPDLPPQSHSMSARDFVLKGLRARGYALTQKSEDVFFYDLNGRRQSISVAADQEPDRHTEWYAPGTHGFDQLVARLTEHGRHFVVDGDAESRDATKRAALAWLQLFGGRHEELRVVGVRRCFDGRGLLQTRVTVAHDSYERLIEVQCNAGEPGGSALLEPLPAIIEDPRQVGAGTDHFAQQVLRDHGIAEFMRFYTERRSEEVEAAGRDALRAERLHADFTPRIAATLVGLSGEVTRLVELRVTYTLDGARYASVLKITPRDAQVVEGPAIVRCSKSGALAPSDAIGRCDASGGLVVRHLLQKSEASDQHALREYMIRCSVSGLLVLPNELEQSAVSGDQVLRTLLKQSDISGRKAEPNHMGQCVFTNAVALRSELAISGVSGKSYRCDQEARSQVSGRKGHISEFRKCPVSGRLFAQSECERCSSTGEEVFPGTLEQCDVSRGRVLPSLLEKCSVSGAKAQKKYLVISSVSKSPLLRRLAISSADGKFCSAGEAHTCSWSGEACHPEDMRQCALTGLSVHVRHCSKESSPRLAILAEMLDATRRVADGQDNWATIAQIASFATRGRCTVESAQHLADGEKLAVCVEQRTLMGLRRRHLGFVYSVPQRAILGRIARGKRANDKWAPD